MVPFPVTRGLQTLALLASSVRANPHTGTARKLIVNGAPHGSVVPGLVWFEKPLTQQRPPPPPSPGSLEEFCGKEFSRLLQEAGVQLQRPPLPPKPTDGIFCMGVVLENPAGETWILTAAHCFPKELKEVADQITVWWGGTVRGKGSSWHSAKIDVASIRMPRHQPFQLSGQEQFGPDGFLNSDIALFKIMGKWNGVGGPLIPSTDIVAQNRTRMLLLGWGKIGQEEAKKPSMELLSARVYRRKCFDPTKDALPPMPSPQPAIPPSVLAGMPSECKSPPHKDYEKEFCAGGKDDAGSTTCQGDSGGPVMLESGGKMFVVGIVSRGVECFSAGLFTSVFHWRDWIKQVSGVDAVNPTGGGGGGSQPGGEPDGGLKWYYYLLIAIGVLGLVVTLLVCFRAQAGKGNSAPVPQPVAFPLKKPKKRHGNTHGTIERDQPSRHGTARRR